VALLAAKVAPVTSRFLDIPCSPAPFDTATKAKARIAAHTCEHVKLDQLTRLVVACSPVQQIIYTVCLDDKVKLSVQETKAVIGQSAKLREQ
jgi:hypothetical protein